MVEESIKNYYDFLKGVNRSCTYILPMMGTKRKDFLNLKSCFIGDELRPDLTEHILLLFKFSSDRWFLNYEEELKANPLYVENYDADKFHIMYVFKVPEGQLENYNHFKNSRYSQFDKDYKRHIISFYELRSDNHVIKVLYKLEDKYLELEEKLNVHIPRTQEIGSIIDLNLEVFRDWMKYKNIFNIKGNGENYNLGDIQSA